MPYSWTNVSATTAAVANRYVTSTAMIQGAYTLTATVTPAWARAGLVTVTHTQVGGVTDTLGTIVVVGVDLAGQTRTDTITPLSGTVATGVIPFRTITSITGVDWVRDAGAGSEDTIVCGVAAGCIPLGGTGVLHGVVLNNSVAAAIVISDGATAIATIPASQAAGTYYPYEVTIGRFLKVSTTNTNDVTVFHSDTLPLTYAMS